MTVVGINQTPTLGTISPPSFTLTENTSTPTIVHLSGIGFGLDDVPQVVTVTATSSNPGLIPNPSVTYNSPAGTGTLSFTSGSPT